MADYDRASGNRPSIYGELDRAGIFDREGDEGVDEPTDDPTPTVVGNEIADNTLGVLDYDTLAAALDATLSLFNVPEEFRDSIATNISNVAPLWTHDGSIPEGPDQHIDGSHQFIEVECIRAGANCNSLHSDNFPDRWRG